MTTLSNEAFAVMAACERTKQPFGITVDKICSGQYKFVWAFKIDKEKAQREGYGKTNVKGNIILDTEYPGCPYCGEKRHIVHHRYPHGRAKLEIFRGVGQCRQSGWLYVIRKRNY